MFIIKLFIVFCASCIICSNDAMALSTNNVIISDVAPEQFSVIWSTNEPSSCSLVVFSDPAGVNDISSQLMIISESRDYPPAEENGVMKVTVKKLSKLTTYYFKTISISKTDNKTYLSDQIFSITTENESGVVQNNILVQRILACDGLSLSRGTLMIVNHQDASYPLSAFTGDGFPEGYAGVDLMNFYHKSTRKPLEIDEYGSSVSVNAFGGMLGYATTKAIIDESISTQVINNVAILTRLKEIIPVLQILSGLIPESQPCLYDMNKNNRYELFEVLNALKNL